MDANPEDRGTVEVRNYEEQLASLKKHRQACTTTSDKLRSELADLQARGESADSVLVAGIQNEIQNATNSIAGTDMLINSLERRLAVIIALGEFDRFASDLIGITTDLGAHLSVAASLMRRGRRTAEDMNRWIYELCLEGSTFRQGRRESPIFGLIDDTGDDSPLCALEGMVNIGAFVKSRMDSVRVALETELKRN